VAAHDVRKRLLRDQPLFRDGLGSVWLDIAGGLLIAGALAAWVPAEFWQSFFLVDHPLGAKLWGPIVGPLVAVISFVCSVGNIALAAVLWNWSCSRRRFRGSHAWPASGA